jgi:RNA ligase (TIGR02306 family)
MEERLSTSKVEVFRVGKVENHPDADRLELIEVWGYVCVVKKGQFVEGQLAAYVPPDTILPNTEMFSFIWKRDTDPRERDRRIRATRLRGILSAGLVFEAPEDAVEGDDLWDVLGFEHYQPKISNKGMGGNTKIRPVTGPPIPYAQHKYDVENGYRYPEVIPVGTQVAITEKIHGANARYVCWDGVMYAGSRRLWFTEGDNIWWKITEKYPQIVEFCKDHEGWIVYGEIFGKVQTFRYASTEEDPLDFVCFDIFDGNKFLDKYSMWDYTGQYELPEPPELDICPYDFEKIKLYVEGPSSINGASHIREGIVVTPITELYSRQVGRTIVKFVSNEYLEGE